MNILASALSNLELAILVLGGLSVYFLPSLVSALRKHPSDMAIFILNLLLGWTFLGWVLALVWSFTGVPKPAAPPTIIVHNQIAAGGPPPLPSAPPAPASAFAPPPPADDGPGRFELLGIDQESGMDVTCVVSAESAANAAAKGARQRMTVTRVTRLIPHAPPPEPRDAAAALNALADRAAAPQFEVVSCAHCGNRGRFKKGSAKAFRCAFCHEITPRRTPLLS